MHVPLTPEPLTSLTRHHRQRHGNQLPRHSTTTELPAAAVNTLTAPCVAAQAAWELTVALVAAASTGAAATSSAEAESVDAAFNAGGGAPLTSEGGAASSAAGTGAPSNKESSSEDAPTVRPGCCLQRRRLSR